MLNIQSIRKPKEVLNLCVVIFMYRKLNFVTRNKDPTLYTDKLQFFIEKKQQTVTLEAKINVYKMVLVDTFKETQKIAAYMYEFKQKMKL